MLYYQTMHSELFTELVVVVVQVVYWAVLPVSMISVIMGFTLGWRDCSWGLIPPSEGTWITIMQVGVILYMFLACMNVMRHNIREFGNKHTPVEWDRAILPNPCNPLASFKVRSKAELLKAGIDDRQTWMCGKRTGLLGNWRNRQEGFTYVNGVKFLHWDTTFPGQYLCNSTGLVWARAQSVVTDIWLIVAMLFWFWFLMCLFTPLLFILLGVFVYPERFIPWATAIVAIVLHVVSLTAKLSSYANQIRKEVENQINEVLKADPTGALAGMKDAAMNMAAGSVAEMTSTEAMFSALGIEAPPESNP